MEKTLNDIAKILASKYFYKYKNEFINDSIGLDDLIQEAKIKIIEIKNKYPEKQDRELIKLCHKAISWRLGSLSRDAIQCSNKFYHKKEVNQQLEEDFDNDIESDFAFSLNNIKFNFEEIMSVLNEKEYSVVKEIIKNKTDYTTLASELNLSKRHVIRLYKQSLKKIKEKFLLDN